MSEEGACAQFSAWLKRHEGWSKAGLKTEEATGPPRSRPDRIIVPPVISPLVTYVKTTARYLTCVFPTSSIMTLEYSSQSSYLLYGPAHPSPTRKTPMLHVCVEILRLFSSTLTTKLGRPLRAPLEILSTDGRPRRLNRSDEVLNNQGWLQQLFGIDVNPSHLHSATVAGRTWCEFLFAINRDL
jgi:hypothetical protein